MKFVEKKTWNMILVQMNFIRIPYIYLYFILTKKPTNWMISPPRKLRTYLGPRFQIHKTTTGPDIQGGSQKSRGVILDLGGHIRTFA